MGLGLSFLASCQPSPKPTGRPNLLVFLVDTLRSDHLSVYGYPQPTSPALDRFATRGTRFAALEAVSSWTKPTVATLFTGLAPETHGTNDWPDALPADHDTLAEHLLAAGYETAAFSASSVATAKYGFDRGFENFTQVTKESIETREATSRWATRGALEWLSRRQSRRPFFLYLHVLDPHVPYRPLSEERSRLAPNAEVARGEPEAVLNLPRDAPTQARAWIDTVALYDAEVAGADRAFGELLDGLEKMGLETSTIVVFTSDHGEEFLEHGGVLHGSTLHAESLAIPLVIAGPGVPAGRIVEAPASQLDIPSTLLRLVGLSRVASSLPGRDLVGDDAPGAGTQSSLLYFEDKLVAAIRSGDRKAILTLASPSHLAQRLQVFDLRKDPGELHALSEDAARRDAEVLMAIVERAHRMRRVSQPPPLTEEEEETLRSLGYLGARR